MRARHGMKDGATSGLLTPEDFFAWEQANASDLRQRDERNAAGVQDEVIRAVTHMVQKGYSRADACDYLARHFLCGRRNDVTFTPANVRSALRAIGWRASKPKRAESRGE